MELSISGNDARKTEKSFRQKIIYLRLIYGSIKGL